MSELAAEVARVAGWFGAQGWSPFPFQHEVWAAAARGESGLIHAPTGAGKTYAVWFAALQDWMRRHPDPDAWSDLPPAPLEVVWLTPLRALAADTEQALQRVVADLELPWTVERRTGDTSSHRKQRQLTKPPSALITTPESLSILLSQPKAERIFRHLKFVVVDEWHELLGSKRGVQTELGLARLRRWRPELKTWGLSATLGNLDEALAALLGVDAQGQAQAGTLVRGLVPKEVIIDSVLPESIARFPWAGHLGLTMVEQVARAVEEGQTALVFTNTRNQSERWYQALLAARPTWAGEIALHHGSLAPETREWVENGLREGSLRCVVATSSLDLGVDFTPVDRVLQVGSPKGVARLLQRAGRSGHQPGVTSRATCVPTHALELVEAAAARDAMLAGQMEAREPVYKPLDLLVQHTVTVALGGGFDPFELLDEVRRTYAFRDLSDVEWAWVLSFVVGGGEALQAYPEYQRVAPEAGRFRAADRKVAERHRANIGTIVSDAQIQVKYLTGGNLGSTQESFISRLKPGDKFIFAGKPLEFVRVQDMTAYVRRASSLTGATPRWTGTSLPISVELGEAVRRKLAEAGAGLFSGPEMEVVAPVLRLQGKVSHLPEMEELLLERIKTRDGYHLFLYPFAGKLVHQGLAALLAYRLSRTRPVTFTLTANDYGLELLSPEPAPFEEYVPDLFRTDTLVDDIPASLNESEMARRQFREIARVAGLVNEGPPWQRKSTRQIQVSSNLLYDVFAKYDPDNLLLVQAHREVLERQLEQTRLTATLRRLQAARLVVTTPAKPTPLCFPLLVERMQARLSSEKLADRVRRMVAQLEKWAEE